MVDFAGAHAIVTGGSSGIGLSVGRQLAERGCRVSLIARRQELLDDAAGRLTASGHQVRAMSVDVADRVAVTSSIAGLVAEFGPCDILVTSAGVVEPGYFSTLHDDVFRTTMEIDYFGTLWPIRAVVPSMVERRSGSIVGVSSGAGLVGVFGYSAYSPPKFAVRGLLEVLRCELAPHGIHVGCACPPDTDTPQLAYENQFKPAETAAISGTIKPLSADRVAASIVRGIDKRQFLIAPDVQTRVLARVAGLVPGALHTMFDRQVRKAQSR
ncbi:MAG: 3-dehydrosphinganine reductase [Frankiaceae bacterium]|nr:3-dehydrosphinganine reductase [Frankiaceae bacterium]